jgi:hypothetical protein
MVWLTYKSEIVRRGRLDGRVQNDGSVEFKTTYVE